MKMEQILSYKSRVHFKELLHPEKQTGIHANSYDNIFRKEAKADNSSGQNSGCNRNIMLL